MAWTDAARAAAAASRKAHSRGRVSKKVGMQRFHKERYRSFSHKTKIRVRDPFGAIHKVNNQAGTVLYTNRGALHITKAFYPGKKRR